MIDNECIKDSERNGNVLHITMTKVPEEVSMYVMCYMVADEGIVHSDVLYRPITPEIEWLSFRCAGCRKRAGAPCHIGIFN